MTTASYSPTFAHAQEDRTGRARSEDYSHLVPQLLELAGLPHSDRRHARLREDIITALMPVVRNVANRYSRSYGSPRDDLLQVGAVGLINAVDRWDPERGQGNVLGFVVPYVRGEILRYFRDRTWATRVPRALKDLSMALGQATGPMSQQLGRAPRPSELAARLGVTVDEVLETLDAQTNKQARSLDAVTEDGITSVGSRLGQLDERLDRFEYWHALRPLLEALPARERSILIMRFYDDMTQTQIAEKFGISQMHVSRLLAQTLGSLRIALLDDSPPPTVESPAPKAPDR
jgi:RNA polymerase sigma-B factor